MRISSEFYICIKYIQQLNEKIKKTKIIAVNILTLKWLQLYFKKILVKSIELI